MQTSPPSEERTLVARLGCKRMKEGAALRSTSKLADTLRSELDACVQCTQPGTAASAAAELERRLSAVLFKVQQLQFGISTSCVSGEPTALALRRQNAEMRAEIQQRELLIARHRERLLEWQSQLRILKNAETPTPCGDAP